MSWLFHSIIFLALAVAGFQNAHAVKLPALSGGAAVAQAGKSSTVAVGGAGTTAVRAPAAASSDLDKVLGNRPYSVAGSDGAGELARLSQQGRIPVADREVPGVVSAGVAKEAVVGGAVGLITGGVPGAVVGVATPLLLDWVGRSGLRMNPDTGQAEISSNPDACTTIPCYKYFISTDSPPPSVFANSWSPESACQAWAAWRNSASTSFRFDVVTSGFPAPGCVVNIVTVSSGASSQYTAGLTRSGSAPYTGGTWSTATPQAIRDQLYKTSAPSVAIVKELLDQGVDIQLSPTKVTGPAEVTGDKRVRTLPDGSKVEEQDTIRYGYDGAKVTELSRRTTTTNISPTGERTPAGTTETTTGDSQSTAPPESGSKEPDTPPTDTPLPQVPDLYVRKYPSGMEGIYNRYKEQLKNTSLVQLSSQLMPNVGDGGSCPTWPINLNWDWWIMYGVHDVAPPCWIWAVGKAILILSALLLARALIFGG